MTALLALSAAASLAMFDPLVGQCWSGDMAPGMTDTHCFTAVYGGKHIRDRHDVVKDGKAVYRGETIYSVEGASVSFTYFSSIGGIGRGSATTTADGIAFAGSMRAMPTSASADFAVQWRWVDRSGYDVVKGTSTIRFSKARTATAE